LIHIPDGVRRNSEAELKAFDTTCSRLGGFNPDISFESVDGFLAALAAGPRLPEVQEWLPLLGGDAFERAFADPADAEQAQRSLLVRLRVLQEQLDPGTLMDDPQALRLDPLMSEWTDADRQRLIDDEGVPAEDAAVMQTGALWAEGFLDAVEALPQVWAEPADEASAEMYGAMLDQIAALMIPLADAAYAEHLARYYTRDGAQDPPTRDELVAEACFAAQDLRLFWMDRAPKPETRRVEPTPGRNDPCPCGSGKKYKKCHGQA
jgi:uncharacterized protein